MLIRNSGISFCKYFFLKYRMSRFCKWHRKELRKKTKRNERDKNDLMWIWCVYTVIDKHQAGGEDELVILHHLYFRNYHHQRFNIWRFVHECISSLSLIRMCSFYLFSFKFKWIIFNCMRHNKKRNTYHRRNSFSSRNMRMKVYITFSHTDKAIFLIKKLSCGQLT